MFYQHRFFNFIKRTSVHSAVTLSLLLATSSDVAAREPYPSTLDDYVTLYEIKSYELFRHDSAEYEQRLKRGQEALRRMKKHGGRSAQAATKLWFETAVYSKDTADELPGLPAVAYLKDVDPSILAKRKADSEKNTPFASIEQPPLPSEENVIPDPIATTEPSAEAAKETSGLAAAMTSITKIISPSSESDAIAPLTSNTESVNVDEANSAVSATTNVFQGLASSVVGSIESATTNEEETPLAFDNREIESITTDPLDTGTVEAESIPFAEADAEPFPDIQPASPVAEHAHSEEAEQAADDGWNDVQSVTVDVNTRIAEYNETLTAVQGEVLVALGGDGDELNAVVEKIEALAETRKGIQAELELTAQSTQAVQATGDLESIVKELHKGIFKFPKSPDGLPFKKAVNMLERLEDVEVQLKELFTK